MPESFTEKVEARLAFDPESGGYDEVIGRMLKKKYPLIIPKPPIPDDPTQGQTVAQDTYAHEAWVWHPEEKDWAKHQASFNQDTDRLLKGMSHKTIQNTLDGEKAAGYEVVKSDDGNYYRRPIKK